LRKLDSRAGFKSQLIINAEMLKSQGELIYRQNKGNNKNLSR
jgi:hypothetical protein